MPSYVRGKGRRLLSDAEIVALYVHGQDSATIAAKANCDPGLVLDLVRAAGGKVRRRGGTPLSLPLTDTQICDFYRQGMSGAEIADRAHCVTSTIYNILERNGVRRRAVGHSPQSAAGARAWRRRRRQSREPDDL